MEGEVDPESMTLEEKRKESRRQKREREEREAAIKRDEKVRLGNEGGGIGDNYKSYCRKCKVEFTLETPQCLRCGRDTMTKEERKQELQFKLEEYKEAKMRKQDRKQKWTMWKKTQAMFWKKQTTDYSKWEYFTDSEDEFEELEKNGKPITPDNDPNFQVLKSDMEKRAANQKKRTKESNDLKDKGNEWMKKKRYVEAIKAYSEAIEVQRSNRVVWSNRALAYIKSEQYNEAVDDCTKMLEYSEVMEDGYLLSKELNFKFFARRAMAYEGLKKFDKALEDINEALKLIPDDKSALEAKKGIEERLSEMIKLQTLEKKMEGEAKELKKFTGAQLEGKNQMDQYLALVDGGRQEEVAGYNYLKLKECVEDPELQLYFLKANGLGKIKKVLKQGWYTVLTRAESLKFFTFVHILGAKSPLIVDELVENKFIRNLIKKISDILSEMFTIKQEGTEEQKGPVIEEGLGNHTEQKVEKEDNYDYKILELEELFELLISLTENRKARAYMKEKVHLFGPIFVTVHEHILPQYEKEYSLITSILTLFSNLSMNDTGMKNQEIKESLIANYKTFLLSYFGMILSKSNLKFLGLKKACLTFIVNLLTDKTFRDYCNSMIASFESINKGKTNILVKAEDSNHAAFFIQNLGVSFNQLYKQTSEGKLNQEGVKQGVIEFYEHSTGILLNLFFQITDKSQVLLMQNHFRRWKLDSVCVDILFNGLTFKLNMGILLNRFINVIAKLGFTPSKENDSKIHFIIKELGGLFTEDIDENKEFLADAIRFMASILTEYPELGQTIVEASLEKNETLRNHIRKVLEKDYGNTVR